MSIEETYPGKQRDDEVEDVPTEPDKRREKYGSGEQQETGTGSGALHVPEVGRFQSLEDQIEGHQYIIDVLEADIGELESSVEGLEDDIGELESSVALSESQFSEVRESFREVQGIHDEVENKINEFESKLAAVEEQVADVVDSREPDSVLDIPTLNFIYKSSMLVGLAFSILTGVFVGAVFGAYPVTILMIFISGFLYWAYRRGLQPIYVR